MSGYRDGVDGVQRHIRTLESKLEEQRAVTAAHQATIAARDAEIQELVHLRGKSSQPSVGSHLRLAVIGAVLLAAVASLAVLLWHEHRRADELEARGTQQLAEHAAAQTKASAALRAYEERIDQLVEQHRGAEARHRTRSEDRDGRLDVGAARTALKAVERSIQGCRRPGEPTGRGTVTIVFAPDGHVTKATVGEPFKRTKSGECIAGKFRQMKVAPFTGEPTTVNTSFMLDEPERIPG